jgi:3-oxoacyl-[acyl-carrier-protein] synthase II
MGDMQKTKNIKIIKAGIGWVTGDKFGCENKEILSDHEGIMSLYAKLRRDSILLADIKNFGRFDIHSKLVCCAAALALHDAGIVPSDDVKKSFGIVGTSEEGSLHSNEKYFRDYVEEGRELARGALFIYTLPSSSLAEAAICLGLSGPMMYIGVEEDHIAKALSHAETMIKHGEAETMLAVCYSETEAKCYCLKKKIPELGNREEV